MPYYSILYCTILKDPLPAGRARLVVVAGHLFDQLLQSPSPQCIVANILCFVCLSDYVFLLLFN